MNSLVLRIMGGSHRSLHQHLRALSIGICLALGSMALLAQTPTGRILGTISDSSGAVIPGASVTITDVQRGITRALTTDQAGYYVAPNLSPGQYKVSADARGFRKVERINVGVEVAQDSRIDFTLQTGETSETVVVTGEIPLLNTTSATLGGTLSNKVINDLPLNGRNYENLLQLRPGVMRYPGGGFSTTSTNGLRAEDNAYLVDGLFNSEPFSGQSIINGAGIAGDSATILPVDAIQEFNIQENPPAEYGWKPGAIVNVGLKAGTNSIHGTAYGFGRTTGLDARNYFNTVPNPKTPRQLEQFGGTMGGAIIKDKLFYFGSYEGQRYTVGNSFGLIPSPATSSLGGDPANSIVDAIAGVQQAGLSVSPVSLSLAGCTLGPPVTCTGKGFPLNSTGSLQNGFPNDVRSDNALGKIDYHRNERNSFNGMYFFGNNSGTVEDFIELQPQWLTQIHTRAQVAGGDWLYTPNTNWTNEARFGFNRLYQPTFSADHTIPASQFGINTGVTNPFFGGLPRITIDGFTPLTLGGFNWPKVQGPDQRFQFIDHVSYILGKHAIMFGGEIHRDSFSGGAYAGGKGRIKFGFGTDAFPNATPLEDFFAGVPHQGSVLVGDPTRYIHDWGYAGFLQDDWRVRRNLTLNLGLRYELNTVIKERHDLLGNFDPALGLVQVGKQISSPYNGDHNNFAPRFGLAWDPAGNGHTVIRAGAGIIYETLNWESFLALNNTLGLSSVPTGGIGVTPGGGNIAVGNITFDGSALNWNGTVFPTGTINCAANPCTILGVDRNLRTPYVENWTLNVQHAFNNNVSMEVAYVGDHGSKLTGIRDINQVDPNSPAEIACGHCEQNGRPFNAQFPYLAFVYQMANIYKSNYNGLQATLNARNYHGLTMVAGYTYAHAFDDVGANWDFGFGSGLPQDSMHATREYASSDFDMRHRLTLSLTYALPSRKSFAQMLEGWQVNSIVSLYSAQPWGPIDTGTDVSLTGELVDRWDFFGNPKDFTSGSNPIPYFAFGDPNMPAACLNNAAAIGAMASLQSFGCYAKGSSVMIPPVPGTFGTMSRNMFRDSGFRNWDLSLAKNWRLGERVNTQFRLEFFNILNHPNFANPYGGQNGYGQNDPSAPGAPGVTGFGCGCATPDVSAANPVIGSGGSRAMQLGLKFMF